MKCQSRQSTRILILPNTILFFMERCMSVLKLMKMSWRNWMLLPVIHPVLDTHLQINPQRHPPLLPRHLPIKMPVSIRMSSIWLKTRLFAQLKSSLHLQWSRDHLWPSIATSGLRTPDWRMMWECANVDYCTRLCDYCDVHKLIKWFNFHKSEYVVFMIIEKECLVIRQLKFECDPWKTFEQRVDLMNIQDILAVL